MFDYEILRLIWWAVLGVLLMGFAVMDGFDMGSASLLPFIGRNDSERRIIINTVGPVWEGNQVWLVLGGGAIFAAWPYLYAIAFSGFYFAMLVVLLTLILRPVAFKFRSKMPGARWRSVWDACLCISGTVPPIIFGVAFGNALQGVPFVFDDTMRMTYSGTFFELLNPFALLCGVLSLSMFLLQGSCWLAVKTEGKVEKRARKIAFAMAHITPALFVFAGLWIMESIKGYRITSAIDTQGPSNPMLKTVVTEVGIWVDNYQRMPMTILVPFLVIIGVLLVLIGLKMKKPLTSFFGSSLVQMGIIGTAGVSMFPFLLPSSADANASLTVWDASSSRGTLITMTLVTVVFLPIVLLYTSWVYRVLRGKVTAAHIKEQGDSLY
ncbi:MAG: cytochrome d ubiquinol oxidase subunit II [Alphaproteobacteria bacterium]